MTLGSNGVMRRSAGTSTPITELPCDEETKMTASSSKPEKIFWRAQTSLSDAEDESSVESSFLFEEATTATADELRKVGGNGFPALGQDAYSVVKDEKTESFFVEMDLDVEEYMAKRQMTPLQERMNAITMIPAPLYCMCFILSGSWVSQTLVEEAHEDLDVDMGLATNNAACLDWSSSSWIGEVLFRNIHALPPLTVLAFTFGLFLHAPFSFLYHWKYAHKLRGLALTQHWSRRCDQSMLHVSNAFTAYATSGQWDFFLVNFIFNADCIYQQFKHEVVPRRNQARLGLSILAWTIPILRRGEMDMFFQVLAVLIFAIFLFIAYPWPILGWSHTAFHVALLPLMPMVMEVALSLSSSQGALKEASYCVALAQRQMIS